MGACAPRSVFVRLAGATLLSVLPNVLENQVHGRRSVVAARLPELG
jgi:hypothetical protein